MMRQDPTDPTGVRSPKREHAGSGDASTRARQRKANAALELKKAGADWAEIAEALGYPTPRQALVAVETALERNLTDPDREYLRMLAGARLDRLLRAVWAKAIDPAHPDQLAAAGRAREFVADFRKLHGLDAPTEVVVHNPTQQELEAWVSTVVSTQIPAVEEYDIFEGEVVESIDAPPSMEDF